MKVAHGRGFFGVDVVYPVMRNSRRLVSAVGFVMTENVFRIGDVDHSGKLVSAAARILQG